MALNRDPINGSEFLDQPFCLTNFISYCSLGKATGYGPDDQVIGVRFPAWDVNFFLRHHVQPGSGTHPKSYAMNNGESFREAKRPDRKADHSPPSSTEVKE
jgi:hypothetical protein